MKEVICLKKKYRKGQRHQHCKDRDWELAGVKNRHHAINRVNGGKDTPTNIYTWDMNVHKAFHFIFGNMNFKEAAAWLLYVDEQKQLGNELDIQVE